MNSLTDGIVEDELAIDENGVEIGVIVEAMADVVDDVDQALAYDLVLLSCDDLMLE